MGRDTVLHGFCVGSCPSFPHSCPVSSDESHMVVSMLHSLECIGPPLTIGPPEN